MEREAFLRARRFLSYSPVAKWTALTTAVASAVLYVALLAVLALFADLMVHRGRIPGYGDLPRHRQEKFRETWAGLPAAEQLRALRDAGLDDALGAKLSGTEFTRLSEHEQNLAWRAHVNQLLGRWVGDEAAATFRSDYFGRAALPERDAGLDRGVLSFVVRSEDRFYGPVLGFIAAGNPWMWRNGDPWSASPFQLPSFSFLTGLFLIALTLALVRSFLKYLTHTSAARACVAASTRLRRAVYHHTFRLGTLAFRSLGPSEAVSVFTRHVEAVHDGLYTWLTVVFREPVKFGLLLLFAVAVNFWLALAFVLFALLMWLIGGQLAAYFRRQGRLASRRAAEQLALIQESLILMRLVKTYLMELFNQSRVERQLARYARAQMVRSRGEAIYRPILVFLSVVAACLLLFVGGLIVLSGQLGVANGITLATALVSMYFPMLNWLENRRYLRRARASAVGLFQFLDRPGEVGQVVGAEFLPPMTRRLEFDGVTLKEPGTGKTLLEDVTLTIQAGQRVALVGADDNEKHALVYLIPRFLDPASGEIRVDGRNLRWVTLDSLRAQTALVLQNSLLFNDTVANNIGCGDPSYSLPQIIEAAKIAHAHQFIQKLPRGYETPVGEMGHRLAIGEQFRIALARAILRDPALLIVEEPAVTLDDETKALLDDTFARVLPNRTTIFLPHRVSTIRSCDRVFLIHKGRVEAAGEHRELLTQNELYRHLQYLEFNVFAEQV